MQFTSRGILVLIFVITLTTTCRGQATITPQEFFLGMQEGQYDAVVDVRTQTEWNAGHIENATFVENLASTGTPDLIFGCEECVLAVYCRSGSRAGAAITRLRTEFGFNGTLYNALGTNQWTDAGYPLVFTESVAPECSDLNSGTCRLQSTDVPSIMPTAAPTLSESSDPTLQPSTSSPSGLPTAVLAEVSSPRTASPSTSPTKAPSKQPTFLPETLAPTESNVPSIMPTPIAVSNSPSNAQSSPETPHGDPTVAPTSTSTSSSLPTTKPDDDSGSPRHAFIPPFVSLSALLSTVAFALH